MEETRDIFIDGETEVSPLNNFTLALKSKSHEKTISDKYVWNDQLKLKKTSLYINFNKNNVVRTE